MKTKNNKSGDRWMTCMMCGKSIIVRSGERAICPPCDERYKKDTAEILKKVFLR